MKKRCFHLLVFSIALLAVHSQNLGDYVSIDCGNSISYTDKNTSLVFSPDDKYIDTGVNYNISSSYVSQIVQGTYLTLRSFPVGNRNCYTLKPAMQNRRYLIRATFFYGNYDGKYATSDKFLFDLHMGVNFWRTVNISDASQTVEYEAIIVALADFVSVCLVNKGSGTPFISSLEMRPLKSSLYPTVTASSFFDLSLRRVDLGGSKITRYPDDPYDRIWYPRCNMWTLVKTKLNVSTDGFYEVPNVVLQTAILPINSTNSTVPQVADPTLNISLYWPVDPSVQKPSYYANLHFADVQQLPPNGLREFNVFWNGYLFADKVRPSYLLNEPYSSQSPFQNPNGSDSHMLTLTSTQNATVPPLLNAIEVFNLLPVKTAMTNLSDVDAIMNIKSEYQVKKNWSGDPCAPVVYTWEDLGCNYDSSSPRIVSLNLSDSGLSGPISTSFSLLEALNILDLSNNKLNGSIPDFLGKMPSLQFLDLSNNSLSGTIPQVLLARSNSGQLTLRTNNSGILTAVPSGKKSNIALVIAIIAVIFGLILVASFIAWIMHKSSLSGHRLHPVPNDEPLVHLKIKKYTKMELESITQNFTTQIGKGGFGIVFAGTLPDENGTKVAVKKRSDDADQGSKEFLTEVENLAMLHHRNLVSLVGYCEEHDCLALVYEYMSQGTLADHLRGRRSQGKTLSWRQRLQISFQAAEGLNYLHQGCSVRFIHRDVKSSNILLTDDLTAKVSDLGIARLLSNLKTETLATLCGSEGYMDPYLAMGFVTQKSDVYSFGVILLEIITGEPPGVKDPEGVILVVRVREKMARQNSGIENIIDARLKGDYSLDSMWCVYELARECTHDDPQLRPTMEAVVTELKNALKMEDHRHKNGQNNQSMISIQSINTNSNPAETTNQNFRTASDIIGHGPDLR